MSNCNELTDLVHGINTGKEISVSYGLYNPVTQTCIIVFTLKVGKDDQRMTVIIPVTSDDRSHRAYISCYSGIQGISTILNILCKQYSITQGSVTLGHDGLSTL